MGTVSSLSVFGPFYYHCSDIVNVIESSYGKWWRESNADLYSIIRNKTPGILISWAHTSHRIHAFSWVPNSFGVSLESKVYIWVGGEYVMLQCHAWCMTSYHRKKIDSVIWVFDLKS